jgi:hypothetical protein
MREALKKKIKDAWGEEHEYEVNPFFATLGWRYQIKLGKMIAPAIKEALSALPKGSLDKILSGDIDPKIFGSAIESFMDSLAANDPKGEFMSELLSGTTRDGKQLSKLEIDMVYSSNYAELVNALITVVVGNGFFGIGVGGGLLKSIEKLQTN